MGFLGYPRPQFSVNSGWMLPKKTNSSLGLRLAEMALGMEDFPRADFSRPHGEPGLVPADSLSWEVFANPVALFLGGVAAVLLELGEPRVRTGVWEHTTFRTKPLARMQRTGFAAMVTVYGPRSMAEPMIARIRAMHEKVRGTAPDGQAYHANDPVLLDWVHVTASFGFLEAFSRFVRPVSEQEKDAYYAEGRAAAELYGATGAPRTERERVGQFEKMLPLLERSEIIFEFLGIMNQTRILPGPSRVLQRILVRAAIDLLPRPVRGRLDLGEAYDLGGYERRFVSGLARSLGTIAPAGSPSRQAGRRLRGVEGSAPGPAWKL